MIFLSMKLWVVVNSVIDYMEELECKLNKKARLFNLYIDIKYEFRGGVI